MRFSMLSLRTKRVISFVLALTIVLSTVVPICTLEASASTRDSYYEKYGITYEQLFTLYPEYLASDVEDQVTDNVISVYTDVLDNYTSADTFLASYVYLLRENAGFSFALREIWAGLNLGESTEKQMKLDTITLLMENIASSNTALSEVVDAVEKRFSVINDVYDLTTTVEKALFISDLKEACTGLSDAKINAITEELFTDEVSKKFKNISNVIEISDVFASLFAMYELETEIINVVKDSVPQNSGIKEAIDVYLQKRSTPEMFIATYTSNKVLSILEEGLLDAILTGDPLTKVAMITISLAANVLYSGPDAADVYRATVLGGYVQGIYSAVASKRIEFRQTGLVGADDIADYQILYTAYVESIRTTLESTKPLATDNYVGSVDAAISICNKLTYDKYIDLCMKELKADIDAGIVAPPGGVDGDIAACVKEVYPSYGTIVITKENANIMDRPCSVNTDATAQRIESGALNAEYIVTGLYKNTANNYWYQIRAKNGKTGYIYSGNCTHTAYLSDISVTGLDVPVQINVGSRYYIKGTISTVYTNLTNISFQVYDQNGNRRTGGTVDVTGKSYVLANSAIDVAAEFNILEAGTYHCVLEATVDNYSATECYREKVLLHTNKLVVGNTSSSTTISTATITTKLNALKPKLNGKYWNYYSVCGVHDNNVHNALKAVVDNGILDKANPSNAEMGVTASPCTDYCRSNYFGGGWQCFGFAWWIEYYLFRSLPGTNPSDWTYYSGASLNSITLQPGDYIRIDNGTIVHSAVVLDVTGGALQCVEAWGGVGCQINWSNAFYATGCYCYTVDSMMAALKTYGGHVYRNNNVILGSVCSHNYEATDQPATCTNDGLRTSICSKCGDSYTESIPALGHDYQGVETAPTCSSMGFVTYTCLRCGDSYIENDEQSWSEWSDIYPEGFSASLIQEKTEYRYRDKEFTTSASNELDGWTLIGPTTVYGDYGSWSAWGDSPVSASDERKVETRTVWPYYYFLCTNCGMHMHGYGNCYTWAGGCGAPTYESGWREVWSTTSWDHAGFGDWYGTGKYYAYVEGQLVFKLTGVSSKTQYRYCTREIVEGYSFYRWGEWSEWSDTAYTATDDRNVESRTLYRYYTGPLGEHDWDQGIVTEESTCVAEGVKTHTCQICGEVENRSIPVSDHHYTSEVIGATCTEYSYIRYTCIDCGHSYEVYADEDYSEWSEDYPEGVDEKLIESKIEYRYSDYETITSYEPELDGYELIGSEWQESASGTITYASSWPSGFSTSHNLYAAYNHSPKSASETATDKTVINSDNHTGYIYWHWCRGTYAGGPINRTISDHYTGEYNKFHAFYTTSSGSEFDPSGIYGYGAHYYANGSCCSDSYWYYPISVKTQNYTSYRNLFTYGRWSDWSEWSETEYMENVSRRVENRTLYRYLTAPSGEHSWDRGVVTKEPTEETEGERLYTCTACGATRTETIPVIGHEHSYGTIVTAPTCTEQGYTTYTCRCGESYTEDYVDALGHAWGDWIVIQEPTTTENGVEEHTCTRCGHAEQRSIAKLENPFNDVAPGSFYYEPVMWAIENGITSGTTPTTFGPNDQCMRAHVVTFLWRAVGSPEPKLMVNPFVDVKPTDFYYKPVLWALENGITSGMDATHFGPTAYCNRAQVVTFLYRTMGSPDVGAATNPFTDVAAGSFYENPVLWAVENGVTAGLSATSFGPNSICNRAQIVTFLYRAFVD